MKLLIYIFFLTIFHMSEYKPHILEKELYKKAYNYLNDSILKVKFPSIKNFKKNCKSCCIKGMKLKFEKDLQVADKFIENDHGFPLCDLLKRKYHIKESCTYVLGSGKFKLTNHVQDSMKTFWEDYIPKTRKEILKSIRGLISKRKDGYQVFFSDIYKNTLAAELKGFCLPNDETTWWGSSVSFFFVFDEKGEIKEVYSGTSIHYN